MAYNVTLSALRDRIRERGEINANYTTNAVLDDWINGSIASLYDAIITSNTDYYLSAQDITVVPGTDSYSVAADLYKVVGVDALVETDRWRLMTPFNFAERNLYQGSNPGTLAVLRYRIMGSKVRLSPSPTVGGTIRVWYVPTPPILALDADTLDSVAGWDEYVVADVLVKHAGKEGVDPTVWAAQREDALGRVRRMSARIDMGEPKRIRDWRMESLGGRYGGDPYLGRLW